MDPRVTLGLAVTGLLLGVGGCGKGPETAEAPKAAAKVAEKAPPRTETKKPPPKAEAIAAKPAEPVIRISPATATIEPGDPGIQLLVEADGQHGGKRDLTSQVNWKAEPAG